MNMTHGARAAGQRDNGVRTALGAVAFVAVLIAALFVVRRYSGAPAGPAAAVPEHQHDGPTAATASSQPVMLTAADARRIGVTFAVASLEPVTHQVRAVGALLIDESSARSISVFVDGWVDRVFVDSPGRDVAAGGDLVSIYSPTLVGAEEELLLAKRLASRVTSGTADAVASAGDLLSGARARLRSLGMPDADISRLEQRGEAERTFTLRSPVAGVVVDKQVVQGQGIAAGQSLFRIADLSSVWLEAEVFEQDLVAVRPGMRVTAELRALPGVERTGRVTYVAPALDAATRTARIRVALPNPRRDLKPGMFATVRFDAPSPSGIVSVPRSAVLSTGERSIVFVKRADGMLEPRLVTLGAANDERSQVLRGLAIGDTVVASATFLVDAESSLGTALGGMGDMPGMDMTKPAVRAPAPRKE